MRGPKSSRTIIWLGASKTPAAGDAVQPSPLLSSSGSLVRTSDYVVRSTGSIEYPIFTGYSPSGTRGPRASTGGVGYSPSGARAPVLFVAFAHFARALWVIFAPCTDGSGGKSLGVHWWVGWSSAWAAAPAVGGSVGRPFLARFWAPHSPEAATHCVLQGYTKVNKEKVEK